MLARSISSDKILQRATALGLARVAARKRAAAKRRYRSLAQKQKPVPVAERAEPSEKSKIRKLTRWSLQDSARELLPDERQLQKCFRSLRWGGEKAQVWSGTRGACFGGLIQCGCLWICPVCAAKISDQRRRELQLAVDNAVSAGHGVSLVTLTVRHGLRNKLSEFLPSFKAAVRRFKSGRPYTKLMAKFGALGEVRALEVTHGKKHGFHPHTHALFFSQGPLKGHALVDLKRRLYVLWRRACMHEGLPLPSYAHGVDVRGARYAANYVAKWGFARELAAVTLKRGKYGRTPFELLGDFQGGDAEAGILFREYAQCFKGARQLVWSRGLWERLDMPGENSMTDQQAMDLDEKQDDMQLVLTIDPDTWAVILRAHARASVLSAAMEGRASLCGLLNRLRCTVPLWNGEILGPKSEWEV